MNAISSTYRVVGGRVAVGLSKRSMALLNNLGRPTRRGVRKCPGCGTMNGTRTLMCKNKLCGHIFRVKKTPKQAIITGAVCANSATFKAVKVLTGSLLHLFSVYSNTQQYERVGGYLCHGFVQLPRVQDSDGNAVDHVDPTVYALTGQCQVPGCNYEPSGGGEATGDEEVETAAGTPLDCCPHVIAAIVCQSEAQTQRTEEDVVQDQMEARGHSIPLSISHDLIDALPIPDDIRTELAEWTSTSMDDGGAPVVQHIATTSTMIVRCSVDAHHPFGFLHFRVMTGAKRGSGRQGFICDCSTTRGLMGGHAGSSSATKCIHFYACVCALVSDERLSQQFKSFIQLLTRCDGQEIEIHFSENIDEDNKAAMRVTDRIAEQGSCGSLHEIGQDEFAGEDCAISHTKHDDANEESCAERSMEIVNHKISANISCNTRMNKSTRKPVLVVRKLTTNALSSSYSGTPSRTSLGGSDARSEAVISFRGASNANIIKRVVEELPTAELTQFAPLSSETLDESDVYLSFIEWLSSVTERINNCMHFQFDGKPAPLVFYIPQKMFDCLQIRLSSGSRKKRLPNWMCRFERRDEPPVGTFTRCTWHITNILHLKQIFDTPQVYVFCCVDNHHPTPVTLAFGLRQRFYKHKIQLDVTRNFTQNRDGSYTHLADVSTAGGDNSKSFNDSRQIRPSLLKTYIKVGNTSPEQTEPTPFIVEWIANVLPETNVGELRLSFEYGHQRNGQRINFAGDVIT